MSQVRRLRSIGLALLSAAALSACCADGTCIKDPPCRPCEDPCCLTPVQRTALKGGDHALPGPIVYLYAGKTYILFTEKGRKAFEKDPVEYEEKGAIRLLTDTGTYRVDVDPGEGTDLSVYAAGAQPYVPAPK